MNEQGQWIVTPDPFTRRLLVALAVLMAVLAVELWVVSPGGTAPAMAQIPNAGGQRQELVQEAKRTNQLLERIAACLESKRIKVSVGTDEKQTKRAGPSGR